MDKLTDEARLVKRRVDFSRIAKASAAHAERLAPAWLPRGGKREGDEWTALNPTRPDQHPGSFRVDLKTGKWIDHATGDHGKDIISLWAYLNACNQVEAAVAVAELIGEDPYDGAANAQGLTLEAYAAAKRLDVERLRQLGLETIGRKGRWAIAIPYRRRDGSFARNRIRVALDKPANGSPRVFWDDDKPAGTLLYGLDQLPQRGCPLFLAEGESDCHTLWPRGWDAVGVPGAQNYNPGRDDEELAGYDVIALIEPDGGGEALLDRLARSTLRGAMRAVRFQRFVEETTGIKGVKDPSELHVKAPEQFDAVMRRIIDGATPLELLLAARRPETPAAEVRPRLPEGFRYGPDGSIDYLAARADDDEDAAEAWSWLCSPMEVLAETRGEDNRNWGLLVRVQTPDGQWHQQAIARALFCTASEDVIGLLANLGLRFVPSKAVKGRLKALLAMTRSDKRARTASRIGWLGPGMFVLPDEMFGKAPGECVVFQPERPLPHAYRLGGSYEGWRAEVAARALGNSRLEFAAAAAFAGPLLQPLEIEGGGFHYRGDSSTGKTSTLRVAGSVWGGGGMSGFIKTWRATDNGLEHHAMLHSDTLFLLDELGQVAGSAASRTVYMLSNGQGKARAAQGGEGRPVAEFRVLLLSTGEMGLEAKMSEDGQQVMAGQEARFVDIEADAGAGLGAFEDLHGFDDGETFSDALKLASNAHYGHAGRAFLRKLLDDVDGAKAAARERMEAFAARARLEGATSQVTRVAKRFALVAAAGELATAWGVLPWPKGQAMAAAARLLREWRERRGADVPLESLKILAQTRGVIEKHGASRFTPWELPSTPVSNRLGFVKRDGDNLTYYVFPQAFAEEFCKGFDPKRVVRELVAIGALALDKERKAAKKARLPGGGVQRVYLIDGAALFAAD